MSAQKDRSNMIIPARLHSSGFEKSDSNFYSLSLASDGNVYYTLCSHDLNTHGRVYCYNPSSDKVVLLGDLGELTGEAGTKSIPQGKSHCPFFECDGKLYFSTQYGFFMSSDNKERPAGVPEGYRPYPGGHFLSYDLASGEFEDLVVGPPEEGIVAMQVDPERKRMYGLTWPIGYFLVYDISTRHLQNLGKVSRQGEVGEGRDYFCLCRSMGLWPETGDVYFTNADGEILMYRVEKNQVESVPDITMKRDIFGAWDPHKPGHQGYNWRDIFWHAQEKVFYGVHPKSAWLFRFDPVEPRLSLIDRICSKEFRESGRFEVFRYGYLSLRLGLDRETIFYLTSGEVPTGDGEKQKEVVHLVTYHLPTGYYQDHGVLKLSDGRYPKMAHCLAVHPNGRLYSCPWIEPKPHPQNENVPDECDLISFDQPDLSDCYGSR
ncbi:MAG: hypothetical protein WDA18_07835 [Candidatus Ratteibacteria bacterium]